MRTLALLLLALTLPLGPAIAEPATDDRTPAAAEPDRADRRDRGRHAGRHGPPLADADAGQVLQIIARIDPGLGERLTELRSDDPDQFARELGERFRRYHWLLRLKKYDQPMYELRVEDVRLWRRSRELADRLREAEAEQDENQATALRARLHAVVTEHFALRQQVREAELARLERRLQELKERLSERARNRQAFIDEHIRSLIEGEPRRGHDRDHDRDRDDDHDRHDD